MLIQADEAADQDGDVQRAQRCFQRRKRLCGGSDWHDVAIAEGGDRHKAKVGHMLPCELGPNR